MERITTSTRAVDLHGKGRDGWRDGNNNTGVRATQFNANFVNNVQEEIAGVIEGAGMQLDGNNMKQMLAAIRKMISQVPPAPIELPVGAVVHYPKSVNPGENYLLCNGNSFSAAVYSELANILKSTNTPRLQHSDIGQTAYFPLNHPPQGWIYFDDIAQFVNMDSYPELYQYLVNKYGSIGAVPKVSDRYIRNGGNIGELQADMIKSHNHRYRRGHITNNVDWEQRIERRSANIVYDGDGRFDDPGDIVTTSSDGGHETRPKTIVMGLFIKAESPLSLTNAWIRAK